jgi:acyl carrier protein
METDTVLTLIREFTVRRCEERSLPIPDVGEETVLLGDTVGLDSLDVATLIFELQQATDYDPFADGFIEFMNAGELARLFGVGVR